MGCGGSKKSERGRSSIADGEKQVVVHVGDKVKPVDGVAPVLVFVFGGPGSRKGRLVSELVETYGFQFINVERLLLHHLLKKAPDSDGVGASFDPQNVIKEEPDLVSLHWLLGEVSQMMEQYSHETSSPSSLSSPSRVIVDIMPNLKFLINSEVFLANCTGDMKTFEEKHPITFALNFVQRSAKKSKKEAEPVKEKEEKATIYSDEADSSRTRRRITLFDNNVHPFIDYFSNSDRLVSLDVTGVRTEMVWTRLCDLFADLHIKSQANVNYVLIFVFGAEEMAQVGSGPSDLHTVHLKSLVEGPDTSLNDCLTALCRHLDTCDPATRAFLINGADTCLPTLTAQHQTNNGHSVVFVDEEVCQLPPMFLTTTLNNKSKGGNSASPPPPKFRAVSSTENRVCFFPCHVPVTACKEIAIILGNHLIR